MLNGTTWVLEPQRTDPVTHVALFLAGADYIANTSSLVTCLSC